MAKTFRQALRYVGVGVIVYATDMCVFSALVWGLAVQYLLANVAAKLIAFLIGFLLHRIYTFRGLYVYSSHLQFVLYVIAFALNIITANSTAYVLIDIGGTSVLIGKLVSDVCAIAVVFIFSKTVVFRHKNG